MKFLIILGILITHGYSFLPFPRAGMDETDQIMNRLAKSKSPYLLQHADNPVDWYPWGTEAFDQARKMKRPIFLSIGYSTCHWCHVMEHESFEDEEVARLLNDYFICIKVDREEMPEVDHVYMSVCQAMTGSGGWPLTIIMTPDKEPFFAGTYFPKITRGQRIGLLELLPAINQVWNTDRSKIDNTIRAINEFMRKNSAKNNKSNLSAAAVEAAVNQFIDRYDTLEGGFGRAPKFPSPHNLIFLLRYYESSHDPSVLEMVTHTLSAMNRGGIYDHIGFGFHRYSTDQKWIVPHFEKMLYDQALLALVYLETYKVTGNMDYAITAEEIFKYIERDMTDPLGGYYSAEDADSEGEEGKFYTWTSNELQDVLTPDEMTILKKYYNISTEGNFPDEATGQKTGGNILFYPEENDLKGSADLTKITQKLFKTRDLRIHPLKDDKILTDWNGLMIAAKARGAIVLKNEKLLKSAEKAANFLLKHLRAKDGRLWKRYRDGESGMDGHLDDYAFFIWGLIELYQAGFDIKYLSAAVELTEIALIDFWDDSFGGFFLGSDDAEKLFIRPRTGYDGAIPSGNSVMAMNLLRLGRITGNINWIDQAYDTWDSFADEITKTPSGYAAMLNAFHFESKGPKEIVIVGHLNSSADRKILDIVRSESHYNSVIIFKDLDALNDSLSKVAKWTKEHREINGKPTVFICENFTCKLPT
ncbi:MAG: thioredoxin domain-containing protein, partial [Candidatus Neomarinimicrobiota bacterium]